MKLLFVLENYYPNIGGVETLFKQLVETLAKRGHQVTVITTRPNKTTPTKEYQDNLFIWRIPFPNRYFFTFFSIFPILLHVRKADIVHTTSYNAGLPAFFAAFFLRKKVIITFHEVWNDLWFQLPYMGKIAQWGHYLFEQLLLKLPFYRFIAVSKSTAQSLEKAGIAPAKIQMIYNGINYEEFVSSTPVEKHQQFTYTYFGRLGISKGINLILEAAPILKKQLPHSRLQLIVPKDPAPFLNDIKTYIEQENLQDFIQFYHHLDFETLKKTLLASDCVLIPSYSEGFCFAAVESIALGVPVISSNRTALTEVISGKFINMEEFSAQGLVNAVVQAANGNWQQTSVKRFELDKTIDAYLDLYQQLLQH